LYFINEKKSKIRILYSYFKQKNSNIFTIFLDPSKAEKDCHILNDQEKKEIQNLFDKKINLSNHLSKLKKRKNLLDEKFSIFEKKFEEKEKNFKKLKKNQTKNENNNPIEIEEIGDIVKNFKIENEKKEEIKQFLNKFGKNFIVYKNYEVFTLEKIIDYSSNVYFNHGYLFF